MAKSVDQRGTATSRLKLGEPRDGGSGPDDPTDPGSEPGDERLPRWRLNVLGVLLATALAGSLVLSVSLWVRLSRTRAELADAEAAEETAAARRVAAPPAAEAQVRPTEPRVRPADPQPPPAAVAPAAPQAPVTDRLVLLLTVGTRHYAEKQLRALRQKCRAPLAVYQQRKGRCAWSRCFAVAAREADAEAARECGEVKGQTLRERTDFAQVH